MRSFLTRTRLKNRHRNRIGHLTDSRSSRRLQLETLERRQLLAAEVLQITVENLADDAGLANTPLWIAAHDGSFDIGDSGAAAADFGGLELIAEEGDPSEVVARFAASGAGSDSVVLAPAGFPGAPVFEAGETVVDTFVVEDTLRSQYFSFLSMIIPSNDAFVGNLDPMAYRIFDATGDFLGPRTIEIYGSQIYDAGTEVNDPNGGAAFATAGGDSVDENGVIARHTGLDGFVGAGLPTGQTLGKAFGANTPIARITISQAANPSNPIDGSPPLAQLDATDVGARVDYHEISVTYSDASGIDLNSISTDDLRITGPLLTQLDVLSVETDATPGTVPREVVATYRVAPASGSFTALDNGSYSVVLLGNQVNDTFGISSPSQALGDFDVAAPVRLNITFENLAETGGLGNTPVFISAHEGNFEVGRAGGNASNFAGLELIAEEGDPGELASRFESESSGSHAVIFAPDGFPGAPVFEPAETASGFLDVLNPERNRFFSFASMVIPSNDAFIANLDPRAYQIFDSNGTFAGNRSITVYGQDVWDAGTEINDVTGGAAFSTEGGTSSDEGGVIRRHDGLQEFVGSGTPIGELASAFESMTPIGRFTISLADFPADPIDNKAPLSTSDIADLTVAGQSVHEIRVTYSDPTGVDITSIDIGDIRVTGLFASDALEVIGVTTDSTIDQETRVVTATYQVAPISGNEFSSFDNGLYSVTLLEGQVGDVLGNEVETSSLGSLEILVPVQLTITVENLSDDGGLYQTPFWIGVHEGNFQTARLGARADDFGGLEALAEEGDVGGVIERFASESDGVDGVVLAPDGFAGAPVFDPGEVASQTLSVLHTNVNRYFSFASMLIPSNDAFLANLNSRAYELFDENGFFLGDQTITVTGRDVWDAGTEANAVDGGAAFSTEGGASVDESLPIRRHQGLDAFIGSGLPTGDLLESAFASQSPLARITISLADGASVAVDRDGPTVSVAAADVTIAGTEGHEIQVTYNDPSGIDPTTIGIDDIRVIGPLGRELQVIDVVYDAEIGTTPNSVVATYTVTSQGGEITARDNGRYVVAVSPGEVGDTLGQSAESQVAGEFNVDVGVRLEVSIESLTPASGLAQTPFWIGFHDGSFEVARSGARASEYGGLELIAEEGDPSELVARFLAESSGTGSVITAPEGFAGAPVFEPGETASQVVEVRDSRLNSFFSFASMVIPSNDAFVANRNSRQFRLFDSNGNFRGARQITIYGRDILDAGTEINDPFGGAAYSVEGGDSVDENGVIQRHRGLDEFVGTGVPTGTLGSAFFASMPIATITISLVDPEADVCSGVDGSCSARSVSLQNAGLRADVNRDGRVSALDSLLVVNFLGRFGSLSTIADEAQATGLDLDVGGDSQITALDALIVINDLARLSASAPEGEAESIASLDAVFSQFGVDDEFGETEEESDLLVPAGLF